MIRNMILARLDDDLNYNEGMNSTRNMDTRDSLIKSDLRLHSCCTLGRVFKRRSPNIACSMGLWCFQGLVKVCRPRAVPGHAESLKKPQVF